MSPKPLFIEISLSILLWLMIAIPGLAMKGPLAQAGLDQRLNQAIPMDIQFNDEAGYPVSLGSFFGKRPVVLSMVYYNCPNLCTYILNGEVKSFLALPYTLGQQFEAITVSIDPHETPAIAAAKKAIFLKRYGHPGSASHWHFLTGTASEIKRLANAIGYHYAYDPATKQFAHPSGIVVLTSKGIISRYFFGIEYSPLDLRLGLLDASKGQIGSPIDQLLLCCYHYDPKNGKYDLLIMNLIRMLGTVIALFMAGSIGMVLWAERSRRNQEAKRGEA